MTLRKWYRTGPKIEKPKIKAESGFCGWPYTAYTGTYRVMLGGDVYAVGRSFQEAVEFAKRLYVTQFLPAEERRASVLKILPKSSYAPSLQWDQVRRSPVITWPGERLRF